MNTILYFKNIVTFWTTTGRENEERKKENLYPESLSSSFSQQTFFSSSYQLWFNFLVFFFFCIFVRFKYDFHLHFC